MTTCARAGAAGSARRGTGRGSSRRPGRRRPDAERPLRRPSGHIGFIAPGRVPVRGQGDGRWPVPGWTGAYDWQGWIPFEALPRMLDPAAGVLFNANNRIVPEGYPYLLTADWEAPIGRAGWPSCSRAATSDRRTSPRSRAIALAAGRGPAADPARGRARPRRRRCGPRLSAGIGRCGRTRRAVVVRGLVSGAVTPDLGGRARPAVPVFWASGRSSWRRS